MDTEQEIAPSRSPRAASSRSAAMRTPTAGGWPPGSKFSAKDGNFVPAYALWLFPHGPVFFRESPERESCAKHCNQYQESNQRTNNCEKRIVEEEYSGFQFVYDPCWLVE